MSLVTLKILSGLMVAGGVAGASYYFFNNQSNQTTTESKKPSSSKLSAQDKKFYDCLNAYNKVHVTDNSNQQQFWVSLTESEKYLEDSRWTVDPLYKGQCKQHNQ